MHKCIGCILALGLLLNCSTIRKPTENITTSHVYILDTLTLLDKKRQRKIPIAIYQSRTNQKNGPRHLVILNHGYGANQGGDYLNYSYLSETLAVKGFFVVSIQHELPTDSLVPSSGIPQIVRRPFWDRGADNILFVINELQKMRPKLNFNHITLIGHSMGGDMTALFPQKYPNVVHKIITLDNRRMALPRTKKPQVYSLRSSDLPADENVLPTDEEAGIFGIRMVKLPHTTHNQMNNSADEKQREEIRTYVLEFLND